MIKVNDPKLQNLIDQIYQLNQEQIFRFWPELSDLEKDELIEHIKKLDIEAVKELSKLAVTSVQVTEKEIKLEPTAFTTLEEREESDLHILEYGKNALQKGEVAVFLVAGGQGSRLGFDGPKGIFPITPVKNKSLFQLFAEKILALQKSFQSEIPWYIMTSDTNHQATIDFFENNNYFGLKEEQMSFFRQDMLPAFDLDGKLVLADKNKLFFSPNGHGGSLQALYKNKALDDMQKRGIKYVFYFQVDNVLVQMCDPYFIGYHIKSQAQMSTKVIRKEYPEEKMGVICKINGVEGVIEYSDLSEEDMYATSENDELKYWAGNTAIHLFSVDFLIKQAQGGTHLPFHRAEKLVPQVNESGRIENKKGLKFEMFIFDLLPNADKIFNMEIERSLEFSAVKNSEGKDSPQTAQADLVKSYANTLKKIGTDLKTDENGIPIQKIEISPFLEQQTEKLAEIVNSQSNIDKIQYFE